MKLSKRQKAILYGLILGDAYLQRTGKKNARLRLEHSLKQKEYMAWKYRELRNLFQSQPKELRRIHPRSHRRYAYVRLQSHSSPVLGSLQRQFYDEAQKRKIPIDIADILRSPLTIATWYMDDGYYDRRDQSAHIYLPTYDRQSLQRLAQALVAHHDLTASWYCRPDRRSCQLNFTGISKDKLLQLINPHLISTMRYKTPLDPVTTEL